MLKRENAVLCGHSETGFLNILSNTTKPKQQHSNYLSKTSMPPKKRSRNSSKKPKAKGGSKCLPNTSVIWIIINVSVSSHTQETLKSQRLKKNPCLYPLQRARNVF
jgi:hypothetical protein